METVELIVRDGGIYPQPPSAQELRARTVLAYGFVNGHIVPHIVPNRGASDYTMVLLDADKTQDFNAADELWTIQKPTNTGYIHVAPKFAGWAAQPNRLFLCLQGKNANVEALLRIYFSTPLNFLNERPNDANAIAKLFEKGE